MDTNTAYAAGKRLGNFTKPILRPFVKGLAATAGVMTGVKLFAPQLLEKSPQSEKFEKRTEVAAD